MPTHELDRNGLFLEVLENIDPHLAETLRIEKELSGGELQVVGVSLGVDLDELDEHDRAEAERIMDMMAPPPEIGRIILRSQEQQQALIAAEQISQELGRMYDRAHNGGEVSWMILFLGVLGRIDPKLFEALRLEAEVSGAEVEILHPDEISEGGTALGSVALADEEQVETANYAAEVASALKEMFEKHTVIPDAPEPGRRRRWFGRRNR